MVEQPAHKVCLDLAQLILITQPCLHALKVFLHSCCLGHCNAMNNFLPQRKRDGDMEEVCEFGPDQYRRKAVRQNFVWTSKISLHKQWSVEVQRAET